MTEEDLLVYARNKIGSVWALEALILLHRDPGRSWAIDELIRELRASEAVVAKSLIVLATEGLVDRDERGRYLYRPQSAEAASMADRLIRAYGERPIPVIEAIFSARDDKLQSLADAFLFRKPPK